MPEHRRERLRALVGERIRPHVEGAPHVAGLLHKIDEALQGSGFVATKAWKTSAGAQSYEGWASGRVLGRSLAEYVATWREQFQSKAAQQALGRKHGEARLSAPYNLTQSDVGRISSPPLKGPVRSEAEMEAALINHLVSAMEIQEVKLVSTSDWRADELFVLLFPQFKPEDLMHLDPRWCLNMKFANEPAKSVRKPKKKRSGHVGSRATTTEHDTAVCLDCKKGYKQIPVDDESGRKQRHVVRWDHWVRACATVAKQYPGRALWPTSQTRVVWIDEVKHVILQPQTLQFGATQSSDIFQFLLGLPLTVLRQAGVRLETQIDDVELKSAMGPQTTYVEMLITIAYLGLLGWIVHVTDKKAGQLWPRSEWTFDGQVMRAQDLMTFTPEERDERHRAALKRFLGEQKAGKHHTLRQLAAIAGQQQSSVETHWWTAYVLPQTVQHLAMETRRLAAEYGLERAWEQQIAPLSDSAVMDLSQLTSPKVHGEHMRTATGAAIAVVNADASGYAIGYQAQDLRSGEKIRGSINLKDSERHGVHHTVQECAGTARAAMTAIRHFDLQGTDTKVPSVLKVGNDNTAAIKNLNRPGSKPQMVQPTLELQIEARKRKLVVVAGYLTKWFMDRVTRIDFDSRPRYHMSDLGLNPSVLQCALERLSVAQWPMVDGAACRATRQPTSVAYVSRYPDSEALLQTDIRSFSFSNHPDLNERLLYLFPPEILLTDVLMKISSESRAAPTVIVLPLWKQVPNWWSVAAEALDQFVTVPFHERLYVQPGAPEQIVDPVPWTLIIGLKSGTASDCEVPTRKQQRSRSAPMWMGRAELPSCPTEILPSTTTAEERQYFGGGPRC